MIVKNEAHVIARCLESVRPLVTSWVVVDTGSTDGTQQLARDCMRGLPGELHERPWRDFGTNRTEALTLAKPFGKYVLVIDADDTLELAQGFVLPPLTADAYQLLVRDSATSYWRTHILDAHLDYRYEGVLHEVLVSSWPPREERLSGVVYRRRIEGARSADPEKYLKDATVLERALAQEPSNTRYVFYLAQSWRDAGALRKAQETYRARAAMDGWDEEVWERSPS
jgi:glycosyltransferase involved in cell wall biosynthesis